MPGSNGNRPLIAAGVIVAFALLIAAIWAADVSTATSLAMTGVLVLTGLGVLVFSLQSTRPVDTERVEDQRRRMDETTP